MPSHSVYWDFPTAHSCPKLNIQVSMMSMYGIHMLGVKYLNLQFARKRNWGKRNGGFQLLYQIKASLLSSDCIVKRPATMSGSQSHASFDHWLYCTYQLVLNHHSVLILCTEIFPLYIYIQNWAYKFFHVGVWYPYAMQGLNPNF